MNEKKFDVVKYMREQRQRLNEKLIGMTKEEIVAYFKKPNTKEQIKPCTQ